MLMVMLPWTIRRNPDQCYKVKQAGRNLLDDPSKANVIATPKSDEDVAAKIDACLELLNVFKTEIPPAGVLLDKTKVSLSPGKLYREGHEFIRTKKVLGKGNCAGDIVVVKDKRSGKEHALKTMMISAFKGNEIRCWVDLSDSGYAPQLYLINIQNNKINIHMEILEEAKTLYSVINEHMKGFNTEKNRALVKPFSLYVLDGALEAVTHMHNKGWVHKDLHDGNLMLQKTLKHGLNVKILDFGLAGPLIAPETGLDYKKFKQDILNVVAVFTGLYAGIELVDIWNESSIRQQLEYFTGHMERSVREELFCIVDAALKILEPSDVGQYRELVRDKLDQAMGDDPEDILKRVSLILFPEEFEEVDLPVPQLLAWNVADSKGRDVPDCMFQSHSCAPPQSGDLRDVLQVRMVPDSILDKLRLSTSIRKVD